MYDSIVDSGTVRIVVTMVSRAGDRNYEVIPKTLALSGFLAFFRTLCSPLMLSNLYEFCMNLDVFIVTEYSDFFSF